MNRCSVCGRTVSNKTAHFGLGCLKNMCCLVEMERPKNLKGENLLNAQIAKITKKKWLNKKEKTLLTNRYLTLQLLNKMPLDAYEPMRNKVEKDIDNIGKNKEIESNDIITLKQAYEAFKLYNKFQKIKQRAEEVDSEYIQNFLFENLLFAFSTYYRNKKYFGGVIADIQYYFWKMVCNVLKSTYPNGMEFIEYSLLKNPQNKLIEKGRIIEDIIKDENFKEKIKVHILNNKSNKHFEITEGLNYVSNDLFLALNNTTINIIGNKENDKWKLDITITDRYDFTDFKEIDEYCDDNILKGLLGSTANNMAMISVASGVMHEYNVSIKFRMDWDDKNE